MAWLAVEYGQSGHTHSAQVIRNVYDGRSDGNESRTDCTNSKNNTDITDSTDSTYVPDPFVLSDSFPRSLSSCTVSSPYVFLSLREAENAFTNRVSSKTLFITLKDEEKAPDSWG